MALLPKITDFRALAGGISLLLVGFHLTIMSGMYFIFDRKSFELMHTGWWWEIALNLQIVCYFLMYLCHRERMQDELRWKRRRAGFRFLVAMLGVSTPSFLLVTAASQNWFAAPPSHDVVVFYSATFFGVWLVIAYVLPLLFSVFVRGKKLIYLSIGSNDLFGALIYFSPFIVLLLLFGIESQRGGYWHMILWPILTYLQGSLVYIWAAFSKRKHCDGGLIASDIHLKNTN